MTRLTRGAAIRAKCLDCCGGSAHEVRLCPCSKCALYRFRLGHEEKPCDDTGNGTDVTECDDCASSPAQNKDDKAG